MCVSGFVCVSVKDQRLSAISSPLGSSIPTTLAMDEWLREWMDVLWLVCKLEADILACG